MLIIRMTEGLGNQMQQYALYRALLRRGIDKDIKLDISWYKAIKQREIDLELRLFLDLPLPICSDADREMLLKHGVLAKTISRVVPSVSGKFAESKMYHPEIFNIRNKYVEGYFACQKYYDDIMQELQNLFLFPSHPNKEVHKKNMMLIDEMEQTESVSIHIRRGDYLWKENDALFGNIATEEYYDSAMNYIRERCTKAHFYVFSDDVEYVKQKYTDKNQYTIIDHNTGRNSLFDILLMSHCHANICANSTFSFWGARLNKHKDKKRIRPLTMRNNQFCDPKIMHEYWPGWIMIDRDGSIK